jgi:hypothetical protein
MLESFHCLVFGKKKKKKKERKEENETLQNIYHICLFSNISWHKPLNS